MTSKQEEKQYGITVKKNKDFSEWFSQVLIKTDMIDIRYNVQGFIVHKPWSMKIIKEIYKLFERELENSGHEPVLFPLVIPEENFEKEKEHVEGFKPEVFWITEAGDERLERRLALRPTSETAFYSMYSLWVQSWRDLPLKLYQSVSVYRYEKHTRPFIRGREFLWIEAHDVFRSHEEALQQVYEDMRNSKKVIYEKLGIPFIFLKRPQWDKFAGALDTYAADTLMPDGRVLQISSTHDLGQNFAKAFGITFVDQKGEKRYVWQTCYGPGIWRIVAALIAVHGDDRGLVLPFDVAPIQIIIIPIYYTEEDKKNILDKCYNLEKELRDRGFRVKVDAREDRTPGWKFNEWELKGIPLRFEIGKKELEKGIITVFRRDLLKRERISEEKIYEYLKDVPGRIIENLRSRAEKIFKEGIVVVRSREEVIENIKKGKIIKMPFCDKEECAEDMREATEGGKVRGTEIEEERASGLKCAWCGKEAKKWVYVAKSY
ncbi:MAG: proline--tRNA ligase [Thermoproteales archaeon]|nr:proline--tRNA ligase [Thermoproteales archaeon]